MGIFDLHLFTMQENHKRFADRYFETLNASESAIYAGFTKDAARQSGYQLLQREDIQEYLSSLKAEYAEKAGISKQWVVERFKDISDDAYGSADYSGANKATEMLGKIIGVFEKDNAQSRASLSVTLSKEEAKKIAEDLENEV